MADITVTPAQVTVANMTGFEAFDAIAAEALAAGDAVYITSTGKVGKADANAAGKQQFRGICSKKVGAGQGVSIIKRGFVTGYDLSGLNPDAQVFLSDTAGALGTAAGTMSVVCGRVVANSDAGATKMLYIDADWLRQWA